MSKKKEQYVVTIVEGPWPLAIIREWEPSVALCSVTCELDSVQAVGLLYVMKCKIFKVNSANYISTLVSQSDELL